MGIVCIVSSSLQLRSKLLLLLFGEVPNCGFVYLWKLFNGLDARCLRLGLSGALFEISLLLRVLSPFLFLFA